MLSVLLLGTILKLILSPYTLTGVAVSSITVTITNICWLETATMILTQRIFTLYLQEGIFVKAMKKPNILD